MKFEEALKLKKSLINRKFKSTAGNEMTILIAPADREAQDTWKKGMAYIWDNNNPDILARYYTQEDHFILYGVRQVKHGIFSGGALNLIKHPELLLRPNPTETANY